MVSLILLCSIFRTGKIVNGALVASPNWPIGSRCLLRRRHGESRLSLNCHLFVIQLPGDTRATSNPYNTG